MTKTRILWTDQDSPSYYCIERWASNQLVEFSCLAYLCLSLFQPHFICHFNMSTTDG